MYIFILKSFLNFHFHEGLGKTENSPGHVHAMIQIRDDQHVMDSAEAVELGDYCCWKSFYQDSVEQVLPLSKLFQITKQNIIISYNSMNSQNLYLFTYNSFTF